ASRREDQNSPVARYFRNIVFDMGFSSSLTRGPVSAAKAHLLRTRKGQSAGQLWRIMAALRVLPPPPLRRSGVARSRAAQIAAHRSYSAMIRA
ncbi:MAG: hypothetical protein M3N91_17660, partial [Pseudomonadota bacterium]|nr:hypothetical protein [Pseudomonadota bacterium]